MADTKKCANPTCTCVPPEGDKFCGLIARSSRSDVPMRSYVLQRRSPRVTLNLDGAIVTGRRSEESFVLQPPRAAPVKRRSP